MKKNLFSLVLLLFIFACEKPGDTASSDDPEGGSSTSSASTSTGSGTQSPSTPTNGGTTTPTPPGSSSGTGSSSTLPALALSFGTNVTLYDFTQSQTDKYNAAIAIVKKVVGTDEFRNQVLNHTYNGVKQFVDNRGLTNAQIYQSILDAAEKLTPVKNNIMDVGVKLYYENSNVVGYTSTSITYINVNTKFFNNYTTASVAGNLFHEWLHKLGYGHDSSATASRPYSVPYAVGYMISSLGRNFI